MRYLVTLLFAALSLNAVGQMPYNPDSNGDYSIGSPDLLSFLGVFDTMLVDSSLTCDYEGTALEELISGIFSQTLILDSVYVEYLLIDSSLVYMPGCPEPVLTETVLERSYMFVNGELYSGSSWSSNVGLFNMGRNMYFTFNEDDGTYQIYIYDSEIDALTPISGYTYWNSAAPDCCEGDVPLPFPASWTLDEDGIQVDWGLGSWGFLCEYLRLIPYWHESE
jgi:hypothetical protein